MTRREGPMTPGGRRGHHRVGDGDDPAGRSDQPGRQVPRREVGEVIIG